jgi:tetratricopeptide (TPR) repeat protein
VQVLAAVESQQRIQLYKHLGAVYFRLGDHPNARGCFEEVLRLSEAEDDALGRAMAFYGLGRIAWREGVLEQAMQDLRAGLDWAYLADHAEQLAVTLNMVGVVYSDKADYQTAYTYYQQSMAVAEQSDDPYILTISLINLGCDADTQRDFTAARAYLSKGLALAQSINAQHSIAHALSNLALVIHSEGDQRLALDYVNQALAIDRAIDDRFALSYDLLTAAKIQLALHLPTEARASRQQGLQLAHTLAALPTVLLALLDFSRLFLQTGQVEQAAELAGVVSVHPALTPELKQSILAPLLNQLHAITPSAPITTALARGQTLDLDLVIENLLEKT